MAFLTRGVATVFVLLKKKASDKESLPENTNPIFLQKKLGESTY